MTKRSPGMVLVLSLITFGIYSIIWWVKTKDEMNSIGAQIPTAWLLIVPIANIYWIWKWCEGVEHATSGKMSGAVAFLLVFFLGMIGSAIIQAELNKAIDRKFGGGQLPMARVA